MNFFKVFIINVINNFQEKSRNNSTLEAPIIKEPFTA